MSLQAINIAECRENAEKQFTAEEIAAAKPLMDCFHFKLIEDSRKSYASMVKRYEGHVKKVEGIAAKLDFDGERHDG